MARPQEPFYWAKFAQLEDRFLRLVRNALRRKDGTTGAPSDAAYLLTQGAVIPGDLPSAANLAVSANSGLSVSGNVIGLDVGNITSGGVLRIQSGGTGANSAAGALTNLGAASAADLATHEADMTLHVTGGNAHDHNGGDGAQINHTALSSIGTNTHAQIDTFIASKAAASGLASLDGSSTVVQNPANATATPTASKIPIADGSGNLDRGWVLGSFIVSTTYTSGTAQTHTPNAKTKTMWVRCVGPGGAGGGVTGASSACAAAGGGGAGGYCEKVITSVSGNYTYTVGIGGTAGTAGNNPGNNGSGATTFSGTNASLSAGAGNGGAAMTQGSSLLISAGGSGGTSSGGDINPTGPPGNQGIRLSSSVSASGFGGSSVLGGGAAGRLTNGTVATAALPGAGGGGANSNNNANSLAGGAGGNGCIIIDEFS